MIKNYFKIAWRNICKRPLYSSLNIIGLSTGILFTLLIGAYVWNEMQVNKKLLNSGKQFILTSQWKDPNIGSDLTTLAPLSKTLKEEYPGLIANYYRWDGITSVVSKGDKHFRENIQLGDSTFISMYGFKLLHGNPATALNNPYNVVITKDAAIKYFGKTNVVGELISIQSFSGTQHDFTITGILDDVAENSVTVLNDANHNTFFIPTNTSSYFGRLAFDLWTNIYIPSYIEIKDGINIVTVQKAINQLLEKNAPPGIKENLAVKPVALTAYYLQKDNGLVKRMLYALSFVGLFILLMAIINFVNISISSSTSRIKEIGIRKVLGGVRKQIIIQFLAESGILVLLSTFVAISVYPLVRQFFGELVGKEIPLLTSFPLSFSLIPALVVLLVGLAAGLYPAIWLSSLKSVDSIKGKLKSVNENIWLRKSLTGFQFFIACIVIIAAFIVSQQVNYFFGQSLGYNKEYVVSAQLPRDWSQQGVQKIQTIRDEFAKMPQIRNATVSYEIPDGMNGYQPSVYKAGTDSSVAIPMQSLVTDEHYLETYKIPIKAGTFFNNSVDSTKIVLNEKASLELGWKNVDEAIGKQVRITGSNTIFTIQGIITDFHFGSMQSKIQPNIFFHLKIANAYRYLSFKIIPGNIGKTLEQIEKKWATLLPSTSFEYSFMDETLKKLYKTELQLKKAAYTATILSLIIVLLGVLAQVSLSIQKRTKEIGIRKVLGASVSNIIVLFMKESLSVIMISGLIACPVAWFIMNGWLNNYAYRISLTARPFIFSIAGLAFLTALLIVLQTIKTGIENPVKSLRTE
jgi:putative ABC transport system permease protein